MIALYALVTGLVLASYGLMISAVAVGGYSGVVALTQAGDAGHGGLITAAILVSAAVAAKILAAGVAVLILVLKY